MLTNQEKIEIKVRALKLAEDLEEAKAIYAFLVDGLDDDPLKLGSKSPVHPGKTEEIDWSRPQLVKSIATGRVVQTFGHQTESRFFGADIDSRKQLYWRKDKFVYHGEIPDQKTSAVKEPKTTGLNFLEAMQCLKNGLLVNRAIKIPKPYPLNFPYKLYGDRVGVSNTSMYTASFNINDFLATDWEIV